MKRLVSTLLIIVLLLGMSVSLVGCKKQISEGTEASKLLLANERLDSNVLSGINIGLNSSDVKNLNSGTPLKLTKDSDYIKLSNSNGIYHQWSEFEQHSHSMVEFTQFMDNIEFAVEGAAEDIERMKNKVGATDKWDDGGFIAGEEQMLRVYENADVLIIKRPDHNELEICVRYTNESAKNVYEIYTYIQYDDGSTARMKLVYIPGERYEYMLDNSNGFQDYFIAENSRGYWIATRFGYSEHGANFWPLIIKDGLGYGGSVSIHSDKRDMPIEISSYSIFDPAGNRELFRIYDGDSNGYVELYFTAIKDGFLSVSSNNAWEDVEEGIFSTGHLDRLVTEKGEFIAQSSDKEGEFFFDGGYVQHYYGDDFDYGDIKFNINYENGKNMSDYIIDFDAYASSLGLELYCDMNTVKNSLFHATEYCKEFATSFEWEGYEMSSFENATKARQAFIDSTNNAFEYYNEAKDFPKLEAKQKLSKDAKFADIDTLIMGENTYRDGKITVSDVEIKITDTSLFEISLDYVLKLGLSLCDSEGNPISVNTVALKADSESTSTYSGGDAILHASGSYAIPKNLSQGDYVLVIYAANKDGIRVSEMKKLAFVSIEEGKLDSSAMNIEISNLENNLLATYTIKNTRYIELSSTKETYSYNEVRRVIMQEILAYGYPDSDAVLQYENGNEIDKNASLGKGTYKMTAYLPTSDGLAQSYIYLTIK